MPYLIDPNSGTEMFESDDIVDYMLDTYGPPRDAYSDLVLPCTLTPCALSLALSTDHCP